jgi:hypothetical protein
MLFIIYFISALVTGFLFSVVTSMLLVFGIEQTGGDPGAPVIMLIGFAFFCGVLSIITAAAMSTAKAKYQKEFPVKFSAIIFLLMYLPFHFIGFYFPEVPEQLNFLAIPLVIMLVLSYVPFFHMAAQSLIDIYEFFRRNKSVA